MHSSDRSLRAAAVMVVSLFVTTATNPMAVASASSNSTSNSFISIGDWGGAALGDQDSENVYAVASAMVSYATEHSPNFIVNTGDNFYWCGITSLSDFQIATDFEQPYSDASLQVPWYSVLGNHEYGYNVSAQIEYANVSDVWVMDDRYFTRRVEIGSTGTYMTMVFIDTSPCVSAYRSSSASGWDPCGTEYPTCSLSSNDDDFEGECEFNANILTQDCTTQYEWFQNALDAVDSDDWLVVVGHHPIDEVDVEDFTSVLQEHGFDLYLNGHAHTLSQYTVDNEGAYVTTGAGSLVNTADQKDEHIVAKTSGRDWDWSTAPGRDVASSHSYQTVFNEKVAGFTTHTFSDDLTTLTTDYVSYTGETVHSFTVTKGEGYKAKA